MVEESSLYVNLFDSVEEFPERESESKRVNAGLSRFLVSVKIFLKLFAELQRSRADVVSSVPVTIVVVVVISSSFFVFPVDMTESFDRIWRLLSSR